MKASMLSGETVKKGLGILAATILVLLIITWFFSFWDLDRIISARFYNPETGWYLKKADPWMWLYRYGTIPGIALTITALVGTVITYLRNPDSRWHRYFLVVALTSIVGAGLLVNGILKPYWGRPRPSQLQELGGQYLYRDLLSPGIPGKGKSFPSGHATMGFLFFSLVYFRRKSRTIAWAGGIVGLALGTALSAARVVQGAHFTTDCIWSFGIIWMTATILYYFVLRIPAPVSKTPCRLSRNQKIGIGAIGLFMSVAILLAFLTRRPFYESYYFQLGPIDPKIHELRVGLKSGYVRTSVRYTDQHAPMVLIHARGFAWTGASEIPGKTAANISNNIYQVVFILQKQGYFAELTHHIEVVLPGRYKETLAVVFMDGADKSISQ
jgi:lipid A 4'-phosphatase